MSKKISQETAHQMLEALIEASALFDNYPELIEDMTGTYQVVHAAIDRAQNSKNLTILDVLGNVCHLSDEIYVVSEQNDHRSGVAGKQVRLISGIRDSDGIRRDLPGYHFSKGWRTVCPIDVGDVAKFIGIPSDQLEMK